MQQSLFLAVIGLQLFQVLFLTLHDWLPLGRLNDLAALRTVDSFSKRLAGTIVSTAPFAYGLALSVMHWGEPLGGLLFYWLWISYALLFVGELRAWWFPYLFVNEPARATRYEAMFAKTWSFLPTRHGIRPNALHVLLHISTLLMLIVLAALSR
jgi:hypothetical protein